jgi:molybdenum cofactor biosynthesis enzyme MoaA
VQLIVEFAKRLPGFDKLLREDQIALLKVHLHSIQNVKTIEITRTQKMNEYYETLNGINFAEKSMYSQ